MPGMTEECQERIFKSRVLILGASEIAYVVADYLTRLGTGVIELAGASHYDLQTVAERVELKHGVNIDTQIVVSKTNFDSHATSA